MSPRTRRLVEQQTFVSPFTSIVHELHETFAEPDDPRLASFSAEVAETVGVTGHRIEPNAGSLRDGVENARAAAIGEAVERYSASFVPDSLHLATAAELGDEAVEPDRFALFREDQCGRDFPYRPFTRTTSVRWARGISLSTARPVLVPAQFVFLAGALVAGETPITYPTSSGLACGPTFEQATLRASLEVLERDAFMLTWNARLTLPLLNGSQVRQIQELERRCFAPTRVEFRVVDLSQIHDVPTALAIVRGAACDPVALAVGAACAPSMPEAWEKAVSEAYAVRAWARSLRLRFPDRRFEPDFRDAVSFEDHVLFYAFAENARQASFIDCSTEARPVERIPPLEGEGPAEGIRRIVSQLDQKGIGAYAIDATAPDVRDAGFHVVRVITPELCSLDVPHCARFLGGRRLYEAPFELGLRDSSLSPDEVNPYPHLFP